MMNVKVQVFFGKGNLPSHSVGSFDISINAMKKCLIDGTIAQEEGVFLLLSFEEPLGVKVETRKHCACSYLHAAYARIDSIDYDA